MFLYKFFISIDNFYQTEVFPLGFLDNEFNYTPEGDNIFLRKKLANALTFSNRNTSESPNVTDYTFFETILNDIDLQCQEISFLIQRSCDLGATYTDYWNGYFGVNDGEFDADKCIYKVKPEVDDAYRCYIENKKVEVNILGAGPVIQATNSFLQEDYEFFICRGVDGSCLLPAPNSPTTWRIFHQETFNGQSNIVYYREQQITACQGGVATPPPTGGGATWYQDTFTYGDCTNGLARWVRLATVIYANNPNPEVAAGDCTGLFADVAPPKSVSLSVVITATPITPPIEGYDEAFGPPSVGGNDQGTFIYSVPNNTGSTYAWTELVHGGEGISYNVIGANNGSSIEIEWLIVDTMNLQVTETSDCGVNTPVTRIITVEDPAVFHADFASEPIYGQTQVCKGASAQFTIPQPGSHFDITWTAPGATITAGLHATTVTVLFPDSVTTINVTATIEGDSDTSFTNIAPVSIAVKVTDVVKTMPIKGITYVCPGNPVVGYSIPGHQGATYEWIVTGGTIFSDPTAVSVAVGWGAAGIGTIRVKETINCGCPFILIVSKVNPQPCSENEPDFYWCPFTALVDVTYPNGRALVNILQYMISAMGCTTGAVEIQSNFFEFNSPDTDGGKDCDGNVTTYTPGINYVTELASQVSNLALFPKSDVIDPTSTEPATIAMLTFDDLMRYLRTMFNVYWFVTPSGDLRMEHISYFIKTIAFDLTVGNYLQYIVGKNKFNFDKIDMPKYERWKWMESFHLDFTGAEISYDSACVNQNPDENVKTRAVDKITTDLIYIHEFPDDISKDGFVMMALDTDDSVLTDTGKLSGDVIANVHLSWANLHYNYLRYNRVLCTGNMNLVVQPFCTAAPSKSQKDVPMPLCCGEEIDAITDFIKTQIGDGQIKDAKLSVRSNILTLNLLHDTFLPC